MFPDFFEVDARGAFGSDCRVCGDEMCAFPSRIHNVHDRIVPVRFGQFDDKIDTNRIPSFFRRLHRMEFAHWWLSNRLCPLAGVTSFDVDSDISRHLGPPVISRYEFEGFPSTWVSGDNRVVMLFDDSTA